MVEQPKRKMRYNDKELELLSNTFAENEELLMIIRKYLYSENLLVAEQVELDKIRNTPVVDVLRKAFIPQLNADTPLHENVDMWVSIETKGSNPEEAWLAMKARRIVEDYFIERVEGLNRQIKNEIRLSDLIFKENKTKEEAFIDMSARNTIISHIDNNINILRIIAGEKKETPDEIKKRLQQDSSK